MVPQDPLTLLIAAAVVAAVLLLTSGIRYIPNDRVGIVERRFSAKGSVASGFIARGGEAGFLPDLLRGGLHFMMPLQYRVVRVPLVTIPQGKLGYVFARDGAELPATQALAANGDATNFEDVAGFLRSGGQKGPQRKILREGTYAINLAQFLVVTETSTFFLPLDSNEELSFREMALVLRERNGFAPVVVTGRDDMIGVVTVQDGPSMAQGEIIAPVVGNNGATPGEVHNNFQDPEAFLRAGGQRGRQLQVLVEGTFYINRLFATVELIAKTVVEVGYVGVVVSYTGERGNDLSGADYKHGELVKNGARGVLSEPLMPGKYAFNTYAGKVILVPTTNFILKWNKAEVGSHQLDENLSEISLITRDAFEPSLPLSVVVHIDYRKAPLVVQRFGDVKKLVEQTLDPMVAAYFKNVGQLRTVIQLIHERSAIQSQATNEMRVKFEHYNLELEEVLIGTPGSGGKDNAIEQVLAQLRARQVADEQVETYGRQERAAVKERELREAMARANKQKDLTESEMQIRIEANQGEAEYAKSVQTAARIRTLAEADAERVTRMGLADAIAIEEQVRAYGGPKYQLARETMRQMGAAVIESKCEVVPRVLIQNGGGTGGSGSLFESVLAQLLSDKYEPDEGVQAKQLQAASPEVALMKSALAKAAQTNMVHPPSAQATSASRAVSPPMPGTPTGTR